MELLERNIPKFHFFTAEIYSVLELERAIGGWGLQLYHLSCGPHQLNRLSGLRQCNEWSMEHNIVRAGQYAE
jgi:hypothetical protein